MMQKLMEIRKNIIRMPGRSPSRLTCESFSICYYDGNTGEVIELKTFPKTGEVKDTVQMAIDNKPKYDGLVLWDMNLAE